MKRFSFKLLLFLLAGAIINVAVAWVFSLFPVSSGPISTYRKPLDSDLEWIQRSAPKGFPEDFSNCLEGRLFGRQVLVVETEYDRNYWHMTRARQRSVVRHRFGFPCLAVEWAIWYHESGKWKSGQQQADLTGFGSILRWPLPLQPVRRGFAINTIFYAAILYALFAVLGAVRRRVVVGGRHKRGQCASCGYSLRENVSEKCPECGATLKHKAETQKAMR